MGGPERDKEQLCPTPYIRVLLFLLSRTILNSGAPGEKRRELSPPGGHLFIKNEKRSVGDAGLMGGGGRSFSRVSFKGSPALPFPPVPATPQPYLHFKTAL